MNVADWILWGFVGTILLTTLLSISEGIGLTRMNLPYLLGSAFTTDRDRAKGIGFLVHLGLGWIFSLAYVAAFHAWGGAGWWRGLVVGVVHGLFVLSAGLRILPAVHPRMASEQEGPTRVQQIEPPGFFGMHYGVRTPIMVLVAHAAFGIILGAFYRVG